MTTLTPAHSERRAAFGPTGGGKSHLLRVWAKRFPRQIVLDATGEWSENAEEGRRVEYAEDMEEFQAELADCAKRGGKWRVVLSTEAVNLPALVSLLAPVHRKGKRSFTQLVGGCCLIMDEAYETCSHAKANVARPMWLRGRHHGLSILAASQRPADVGRMVTSQSELVAVTQTSEPIDLVYWRSAMPGEYYPHLLELKPREALLYGRVNRQGSIITTAGVHVRSLSKGGDGDA